MMNTKELPKTLIYAVRYFSDLDVCHEYMISIKWADGKPACPKCGGQNIGNIKSRRMFQCKTKGCRKQFSAKVGTIFEDSPLGLDKWFVAVWCIANAKNGISSCELARAVGITQKSAWHMLHRIRLAMQTKSFKKIKDEVESDECFIGGKAKNLKLSDRKKYGRGGVGKTIVHGLLERSKDGKPSQVDAKVVPSNKRGSLHPRVKSGVEPGTKLYTDQSPAYGGLENDYVHEFVDHTCEYVRDRVHTNGIENFWSLLKRTIGGTYVSVSPVHLDRYIDEQARRFNERKMDDSGRFGSVMRTITGKRLTYKKLIGAAGA